MRALSRRSGLAFATATAAAIALSMPVNAETDDAIARLLAETTAQDQRATKHSSKTKQVEPAERPRPEEERRLIDEVEMLERARAEAEARRAAQSAAEPTSGDAVKAFDLRKAVEERRIAEERQRAEEKQREEATQRTEAERQPNQDRTVSEAERRTEDADYARMEAEREVEALQIDEALRKAREAWSRRQNTRDAPSASATIDPSERPARTFGSAPDAREFAQPDARPDIGSSHREPARIHVVAEPQPDTPRSATRVTVLIVLEPGHRGIRRHNKTADPLICAEKGCYVGAGSGMPAELLPRNQALGMSRTLGDRAGACRNSLGCVFRDIDLVSYPAALQPIDMRFLRHDRREPHVIDKASRCRLDGGRLSCTPILGPDYVMWVVPEGIADRAGSRELERVVQGGLESKSAAIGFDRNLRFSD